MQICMLHLQTKQKWKKLIMLYITQITKYNSSNNIVIFSLQPQTPNVKYTEFHGC